MTAEIIDWDADLPEAEPEEEYQTLVRTFKRTNGFRLLFVECSPAEGERLIAKVQADVPQKKIEVLSLDESVYNFYKIIEDLPERDAINILFVKGLEYSLYEYEKDKKDIGWESKDIYSYSWRGVPPVLINLNQQRERFRDDFKICFVFILPRFAVNYFIQRAPDFFDWRSSLFKLSMDKELLLLESRQACSERWKQEDYLALTPQERKRELVRIQSLIDEDGQTPEQKAALFFEQGLLHDFAEEYAKAIASLDKALEIKPDYHEAWINRGHALGNLGRWEEAIASFDKALEIKTDYHAAWYLRGIALGKLGRWEEAIASLDKALEIKPDYHEAWYIRGYALGNLGRWEEAIASFDKGLEIKPDYHEAWYIRGIALDDLGRWEDAIACFDKALEFKADLYEAWNYRGYVLGNLGRWEEAIASCDKALEIKPDDDATFYTKACCYALHGQIDQAIQNLQQAINLNPDKYREMAKTDSDFDSLRSHTRFQALIQE
ncbi:tetratricopeptide repeat protein [Microcoleus sp. LAD1_D3]|uniref:tetratricopeptide repeat protein n=1 Tax=Microcoleus sp. LAD1_D3 TaxID=2819365 RepID=UPI002FD0B296